MSLRIIAYHEYRPSGTKRPGASQRGKLRRPPPCAPLAVLLTDRQRCERCRVSSPGKGGTGGWVSENHLCLYLGWTPWKCGVRVSYRTATSCDSVCCQRKLGWTGQPGWLRGLSVRLVISAQVPIPGSVGSLLRILSLPPPTPRPHAKEKGLEYTVDNESHCGAGCGFVAQQSGWGGAGRTCTGPGAGGQGG